MPLGYRVQDKIMKLIEKHMQSIGKVETFLQL